jgi:hypothetical protein
MLINYRIALELFNRTYTGTGNVFYLKFLRSLFRSAGAGNVFCSKLYFRKNFNLMYDTLRIIPSNTVMPSVALIP